MPYKHYDAETISGVLDGVVTPADDDAEDYPCMETMLCWLSWLNTNLANIEGALRRAGQELLRLGTDALFTSQSFLDAMRDSFQDWLERTLRIIYNSGGSLSAVH